MPIIVQRYTIAEDVQSVPQAKPAGTGGDPLLELLAAADKCDHDAPDLPTTPTFSERRDGEHVSSLGGVRGGAGLTVEVEFGSSPDSVSAPTAAGTHAHTPARERTPPPPSGEVGQANDGEWRAVRCTSYEPATPLQARYDPPAPPDALIGALGESGALGEGGASDSTPLVFRDARGHLVLPRRTRDAVHVTPCT